MQTRGAEVYRGPLNCFSTVVCHCFCLRLRGLRVTCLPPPVRVVQVKTEGVAALYRGLMAPVLGSHTHPHTHLAGLHDFTVSRSSLAAVTVTVCAHAGYGLINATAFGSYNFAKQQIRTNQWWNAKQGACRVKEIWS